MKRHCRNRERVVLFCTTVLAGFVTARPVAGVEEGVPVGGHVAFEGRMVISGYSLPVLLIPATDAPDRGPAQGDDDVVASAERRGQIAAIRLRKDAFDELMYGGAGLERIRKGEEDRLRGEIAAIDKVCRLTAIQKQKMVVAGRGDIHRLLDRVEAMRPEFDRTWQLDGQFRNLEVESLVSLVDRAKPLQLQLRAGPFGPDSLFLKTFRHTATPEQLALFERKQPSVCTLRQRLLGRGTRIVPKR